ncbi:MAG: RdgB/HAM1 family non-canonical purine NTP pyrophosphatase [Candidatus Micrarchaeota archaeon]|nr:RdgB/HAM1 family non-canonical purine NTP pyrophosphatase [Candidatus Micrarchaeota archaeon]
MDFIFVTSNKHKLREAEQILGRKIKHVALELDELQSLQVSDIVKSKAESAYKIVKKPVVVDDTGVYIKSLNGFPGAFVKWVLMAGGNEIICRLPKSGQSREAYAEVCICLYDGRQHHVFSGKVHGNIAKRPMGNEKFHWDPIFIPRGYRISFAQMSDAEKNRISHRGKAFRKLKKFLGGRK